MLLCAACKDRLCLWRKLSALDDGNKKLLYRCFNLVCYVFMQGLP